jgi:glycosyltransferase involved in cell wall biosynthesis
MLNGCQVIVVVPAFQEEAHLPAVLSSMPCWVDRIVVVDDGSDDRTGERARARSLQDARITVVRHAQRRGVGAAIVTGYREAMASGGRAADAFAVMAGDGQMHPDDLEAVVRPIVESRADYVKGRRFRAPRVRKTMGLPRWAGGHVFSWLTAVAIGQPITDSQCGFTALRREAAHRLDLKGLWPSFGYPNDLLGQLAARRLQIMEVDVRPVYGTEVSKLRLRHLPGIAWLVARAGARRVAAHAELHDLKTESVVSTGDMQKKELRRDSAVSS